MFCLVCFVGKINPIFFFLTWGFSRPYCSCKENKSLCEKMHGIHTLCQRHHGSCQLCSCDQDIALFGRLDSMCQWRNKLQIFRQTSLIMLNCLWHYNNFQVNQRLLVHFYSTRHIYYSTHPAKNDWFSVSPQHCQIRIWAHNTPNISTMTILNGSE